MKEFFLSGILIVFFYAVSFCQKDTEFWFVAPEVSSQHGDRPIFLRLTSFEEASNVKISQPANPSFLINVIVPAHQSRSVDITYNIDKIENKPADHINPYGLLIQSSSPITAYYDEANDWNTDIFVLKGKNSLGKEFYIPTQNSFPNAAAVPDAHNSFDIVATENNTTILITPSNDIIGHPKGVTFSKILNRGETFSCVAANQSADKHLFGSRVTSDKPIAVTVKDDSVIINSGYDLNGDQIVPTNVIGSEYVIVRGYLSPGYNDQVYIISASDNNRIFINGSTGPVKTLNKGDIYPFPIMENNPVAYVKSDYPVYVQHLTGFDTESGSALLPPVKCTGSREVAFTRITLKRMSLTIVTEDGSQGSFAIDGNSTLITASQFTSVPGTSNPTMVYARIPYTVSQIPYGSHILKNSKGNFHLGLILESNQPGCGYGYFSDYAALYIGPDATICSGTPKLLDAGAGKESYAWSTGETTQSIAVSAPGAYTVTTTSSGCMLYDTIVIKTIPSPVVDAGPVDSVDQATSVILSGTAFSASSAMTYRWTPQHSIISGDTTLTPTTARLTKDIVFTLQVIDKDGCSMSDSVKIFVDPGPCAKGHILNHDTTVCPGSVVQLYSKPVLTYQWLSDTGLNDSTIQNPWLVIDSTRTLYLHTTEYGKNLGEIISCSDTVTITTSQNVRLGPDTLISPGQVLDLTFSGGPFDHYTWNTVEITPSISIRDAGNYWLLATDQIGCESSDTINVKSSDSYVVFPNAFTPNADGKNDIFRPRSHNVVKFNMLIYNRWGQFLFETNDTETGWPGIFQGKDCPGGLYVYTATYEFKYLEEAVTAKGSVLLLR